ncbi:MAG: ABC transporter permease, partial [Alphaproteobacteria bacterium]
MKLVMEKRTETPISLMLISPMIAVALTMISAAIMFALLGKDPVAALQTYFLDPLSDSWGLQEVAVKATPLVLIAVGLAVCYRAKVWNIGAEGQFLFGAMAGGYIAIITHGSTQGPWLLPVMLLAGAMAGACFALIPALLRTHFGANEILTSLMLVYVAELLLDYLVRGPWRDPAGFNMPNSVVFEAEATLPLLMAGGRLNIGTPIMIAVVLAFMLLMGRTLKGFEIRLVGEAPRAARFAG